MIRWTDELTPTRPWLSEVLWLVLAMAYVVGIYAVIWSDGVDYGVEVASTSDYIPPRPLYDPIHDCIVVENEWQCR